MQAPARSLDVRGPFRQVPLYVVRHHPGYAVINRVSRWPPRFPMVIHTVPTFRGWLADRSPETDACRAHLAGAMEMMAKIPSQLSERAGRALSHRSSSRAGRNKNAQRNLDFLASASDASTFGDAFDFVAPSGKTNLMVRRTGCLVAYPRVSVFAGLFQTACPQPSHDLPRFVRRDAKIHRC